MNASGAPCVFVRKVIPERRTASVAMGAGNGVLFSLWGLSKDLLEPATLTRDTIRDHTYRAMKPHLPTHQRIHPKYNNRANTKEKLSGWILLAGWLFLPAASAQVTNVVFSDDFSG